MKVSSVQNINRHPVYSPNSSGASLSSSKKKVTPANIMVLGLVSTLAVYKMSHPVQKKVSRYVQNLAESISSAAGKKFEPYSLASIMDKSEFIESTVKLGEKDYVYNPDNIKNFGFQADFHMHTSYSDGKISVSKLLDEISLYADNLFKRTGRKFKFSITDHDSVEGVKEALTIISKNPAKFKNVKFIPGVEISFAHKSPKSANPCEISEFLAYGFDPFKVDKYFNNLQIKRRKTLDSMMADIKKSLPLTNFDKDEFVKNYNINPDCIMMNSHWALYQYAQTKHAVTIQASRTGADASKMYEDIMKNVEVKNKNIWYLKKNNFLDNDINEAVEISNVRKKYEPHFENNTLILTNENSFEDIINLFNDDKNVIMSFAHPYFTAEKFHQPNKALNAFVYKSNGLIQLSEAFHQAYPKGVDAGKVKEINGYIKHLIQIGGSDNHKLNYI